jgi:ATP-binding cassette subfamily B protein
MASFKDLIKYYSDYKLIVFLSIGASGLFELIDLIVPYLIGQILNVISGQKVDDFLQIIIVNISNIVNINSDSQTLSLTVLVTIIFIITVVRAPIQPWIGSWFHWEITLKTRRDYSQKVIEKILSLPLSFYDENNPGRIAGRVARGIANHTWTYPEIAGQLLPKLIRVLGIFFIILLLEKKIAIGFIISFISILIFTLICSGLIKSGRGRFWQGRLS